MYLDINIFKRKQLIMAHKFEHFTKQQFDQWQHQLDETMKMLVRLMEIGKVPNFINADLEYGKQKYTARIERKTPCQHCNDKKKESSPKPIENKKP